MDTQNNAEKLKDKIHTWENELYELSDKAQKEITQSGQKIRDKYDKKYLELQKKADEAKRRLSNLTP